MAADPTLDLARELSALTAGRLEPRADIREPHWRFWEKRTFNIHRVVAVCTYGAPTASALQTQTRDTLALHFRSAWWRGLGFGVVVEAREAPGFPEAYLPLVDGRSNPKGIWQWMILVSRATGHARGMHIWLEGYLSPVYRGLLDRLGAKGFEIESVRKEKDGLMRLLTATKPERFPQFEDSPGRRPSRW